MKKRFRDLRLRANIKRVFRESRKEYINSICTSREHNPKRFWSFFKLKSKVSHIPGKVSRQLNEGEGKRRSYAENSIDIANAFNEYFASIFTQDTDNLETKHYQDEYDHLETNGMLTDIELSEDEVLSVLRNLDQNKAQGPDGIPGRLLIETAYQIAPSLCQLYNKSLRLGILPSEWKLANVVPIHRRCEKSYVENYRPISLLSLISKVLERCVFYNIKNHV